MCVAFTGNKREIDEHDRGKLYDMYAEPIYICMYYIVCKISNTAERRGYADCDREIYGCVDFLLVGIFAASTSIPARVRMYIIIVSALLLCTYIYTTYTYIYVCIHTRFILLYCIFKRVLPSISRLYLMRVVSPMRDSFSHIRLLYLYI